MSVLLDGGAACVVGVNCAHFDLSRPGIALLMIER